jgi:putative transposase
MALSTDLRLRIINAYKMGDGSIRSLAKRFSIGTASVWRLLKRYECEGEITAKSPPGRNNIIDDKATKAIIHLLHEDNDATLEELCIRLTAQYKIKVSVTTMHRACQRIKMRYKKNAISKRTTASRCP